jgi:hypothetical protein
MPHVVPVAVFYDPEAEALVIGANSAFGEGVMTTSKKFRDAQRQPKVAVVVGDPSPATSWPWITRSNDCATSLPSPGAWITPSARTTPYPHGRRVVQSRRR